MLKKAQFTPDPTARAKLLNAAEKLMAQDVMSIPMYVRPGFLINSIEREGPVLNPTQQGSTWNAETWTTVRLRQPVAPGDPPVRPKSRPRLGGGGTSF